MTNFAPVTLTPPAFEVKTTSVARVALYSAGVLAIALALAGTIQALEAGRQPEKGVMIVGIVFAAILTAVPVCYVLRKRREATPGMVGLIFVAAYSVLVLAIYFFWVSWYVFFPADFLIWSEGDFTNDTLKFSVGYPLYSSQVNNDSFTYVPGPQLLTYLLAWAVGKSGSIAAYRAIQLTYTAGAALLATLCCRRLLRLADPSSRSIGNWLWNSLWFATLFLIATNAITNPFTHNLHDDALAQLVTIASYFLLLIYIERPSRTVLAAMMFVAPIGLLVKQSLVIWIAWYGGFLAVFSKSWRRAIVFAAMTGTLCAVVLGFCFAIWGRPFFYWTFYVLGRHPVSPLRSIRHALDAWAYFAAGLLGGVAILRGKNFGPLLGVWLVWLGILLVETYTSGIAWMLNHMGPGCLIAGVWFLAGLASIWETATERSTTVPAEAWFRTAALTASMALMFNGMGLVRIPMRPLSEDAYRYVHDVEKAFEGQPAKNILLDAGTWVYLKDRVVMGDRAPSIGERGFTETGDFSGILSRIEVKRYSKILVRGLHDPDFVYEHYSWPKSSGIRKALLENYRETDTIRAVQAPLAATNGTQDPYYFGAITILEPRGHSEK
jgi:hypothetical protein